ncbi:MAG: SBBP repeat-containing protein [Akkermansiaceae bacterium]|nr:SBBP repeat-containing protein [Verrucomicrobiales bacterium]
MKLSFALYRGFVLVLPWIVLGGLSARSQGAVPDFLWLQTAGGSSVEVPRRVVVDNESSSYVAGSFASTNLSFGSGIVVSNSVRTVGAPNDAFIAKYNSNGVPVWARAFGGGSEDVASDVAVDAQRNVYVTGSFSSTSFLIGGVTLTNYAPGGNGSLFVAKFNPGGNLLWVRASEQSTFSMSGSAIVVDASGNSYVTGNFIGTNSISGTNLVSQGSTDIMLLKYDANGNLTWARQSGGTGLEGIPAAALDKAGNLYLLANIRSTNVAFGGFVFSIQGTDDDQDLIVAKYNPAGTVLWARQYGSTNIEDGSSIAVDGSNNVFITGNFSGGSVTFGGTTLVKSNAFPFSALFTAKLDTLGNALWAKTAQGDFVDFSQSIAVDFAGNSYIVGGFQSSTLRFDAAVTLTNSTQAVFNTEADAFVAKYDPAGNLLWAARNSGVLDERAFSVAVDSTANAYITGWTQGTNVMFGNLATTNVTSDIFLTKLDTDFAWLQISRLNPSSVVLSWPATKSAFSPQFSTNLLTWTNLTGITGTNNGQIQFTNTTAGAKGFFRLKKAN